ncbi:hypothetical protein [Fodinicola feengrottensis]|uniref:hypothetical protein n=1 Tax=Fodinicola feengrottensis TaxID=435914 RepID=UPI0031DAB4A0
MNSQFAQEGGSDEMVYDVGTTLSLMSKTFTLRRVTSSGPAHRRAWATPERRHGC